MITLLAKIIHMSPEQKDKIIDALTERMKKQNRGFACPMCGNNHFVLLDSYLRNDVQEDFESVRLGGPSIPATVIVCSNCGFMSQHALGTLGLLPKKKEPDAPKTEETKG
jgi:hypothetical protein